MDSVEDSALYGLRRLELELVVHDFISALNGRRSAALEIAELRQIHA